jgi:hypothetical protein
MFVSPRAREGRACGHNEDWNDAKCSLNDATATAAPTLWIGVRFAAQAVMLTYCTLQADT